jgi:hypothetical protein
MPFPPTGRGRVSLRRPLALVPAGDIGRRILEWRFGVGCRADQEGRQCTSALNPQPSTINPQPTTLNPQPSTLNPRPSILDANPNGRPQTLSQEMAGMRLNEDGHWEKMRFGGGAGSWAMSRSDSQAHLPSKVDGFSSCTQHVNRAIVCQAEGGGKGLSTQNVHFRIVIQPDCRPRSFSQRTNRKC